MKMDQLPFLFHDYKTAGFSAKKTGAGANEVDPYSGNQISAFF